MKDFYMCMCTTTTTTHTHPTLVADIFHELRRPFFKKTSDQMESSGSFLSSAAPPGYSLIARRKIGRIAKHLQPEIAKWDKHLAGVQGG